MDGSGRDGALIMFLEIYTLHPVTLKRQWIEVIPVESREEAEQILRTSPDLYSLDSVMCSISAPKKSRTPFLVTSWCEFYRPGGFLS